MHNGINNVKKNNILFENARIITWISALFYSDKSLYMYIPPSSRDL